MTPLNVRRCLWRWSNDSTTARIGSGKLAADPNGPCGSLRPLGHAPEPWPPPWFGRGVRLSNPGSPRSSPHGVASAALRFPAVLPDSCGLSRMDPPREPLEARIQPSQT